MKKSLIFLILASFLFTSFTLIAPSKGSYYSSSEGKFSVVFPAQYNEEVDEIEGTKTVKISASNNNQTFFASYTLHTVELSEPKELANTSLNSFNETLGSTITEQSEWKVNKNSGLQATLYMQNGSVKIKYYVILIGQLQYQFAVLAKDASFDDKASDTFIKSFKLHKK